MRRITEEQGEAIAQALKKRNVNASVYVGMRYWKPFTEEAVEKVSLSWTRFHTSMYIQRANKTTSMFALLHIILLPVLAVSEPQVLILYPPCLQSHRYPFVPAFWYFWISIGSCRDGLGALPVFTCIHKGRDQISWCDDSPQNIHFADQER